MNPGILFFLVLAIIAIAAAVAMLFSRNAVYSALFLVVNFSTIAVIYLTLGAPFIALVQITVYAGAIMVLFLFVIMLLGAERLSAREPLTWQRPLAILLGVAMLGEVVYVFLFRAGLNVPLSIPTPTFGSPTEIGLDLFNRYLLPFEVTSVLLLVAMVGAIILTRVEKIKRPGGQATRDEATREQAMKDQAIKDQAIRDQVTRQ